MKKVLSIFIILVMTVSLLAGCAGKKGEAGGTQTENTDQSTKADESGLGAKKEAKADTKTDTKTDSNANKTQNNKQNTSKTPANNNAGNWGDFDWSSVDWDSIDWSKMPQDVDWSNFDPNSFDPNYFINGGESESTENVPNSKRYTELELPPVTYSKANNIEDITLQFNADGTFLFDKASTLYSNDLTLTISAPAGAQVYYTMDGTNPSKDNGTLYSGCIEMKAHGGSFPSAYTMRAVAVYEDGTQSRIAARTFLAAKKLEGRFSTIIISISGDEAELTGAPDGILYGKNYEKRGRESEREVFVEAWRADGTNLFSQFAGVRVYGGYSRQATIKSLKLFARSSYDPDNKNFKISEFGTLKLDGSDKIIKKYDKLVLRNGGNDNQFGFIRDELSQALCRQAGFECYEAVLPVVIYLNGEYYAYFWMHENYCDKYFKEKFGDAEGEFVVLEGGDQKKDDDPDCQKWVNEYNRTYNEFIKMDMTVDSNYAKVKKFMDVESYLNFFAWNIALNNWDWPNNNYKCYRYVEADAATLAAEGAAATPETEQYDGRWRFLVHDMDYTYGLYDQDKTQARYDTLKVVLDENDTRYAPLFKLLMQRKDCRDYFRAKTLEYLAGALSEDSIITTYRTLHATRLDELHYYYKFLQQQNRKGITDLWVTERNYQGNEDQIFYFAEKRGEYVLQYMDKHLPEIE